MVAFHAEAAGQGRERGEQETKDEEEASGGQGAALDPPGG
jgi:hypothetical protein